jgi:pyridoxine 5-phosphate synthase
VEPDPVWAAAQAVLGGAECITFHLRKDRRHIQDRDAELLRKTVTVKLNMEMSLDEEIVKIALALLPDQATLVPESRQEVTTEGGLDARKEFKRLSAVAKELQKAGIVVSAFIDPDGDQVLASYEAGCEAIEIHTGAYANAWLLPPREGREKKVRMALDAIAKGLDAGLRAGLVVHGGHGLTYDNIGPVAALAGFTEFNIGHSIVSRAVFTGLREAVAEMRRFIAEASTGPAR